LKRPEKDSGLLGCCLSKEYYNLYLLNKIEMSDCRLANSLIVHTTKGMCGYFSLSNVCKEVNSLIAGLVRHCPCSKLTETISIYAFTL
jgi:hypothetical protein